MANARFSAMEQTEAAPDYERYDRIWQRVAPTMNPYPQVRAINTAAVPAAAMQQAVNPEVLQPAAQQMQENSELSLPGAEANPCCLGSEAQDMTIVVEGFAQEEAADSATYRQLSRLAPSRGAAATLREIGQNAEQRSRELAAIYYLITGEQKRIFAAAVTLPRLPYRELLRQRYHDTACNALNYARAKDATTDPCLQKLLERFSRESYMAAEQVLKLLSQLQ